MEEPLLGQNTLALISLQAHERFINFLIALRYRAWAHFSTTSTETMEDKIKRLLREEVRQAMENE